MDSLRAEADAASPIRHPQASAQNQLLIREQYSDEPANGVLGQGIHPHPPRPLLLPSQASSDAFQFSFRSDDQFS